MKAINKSYGVAELVKLFSMLVKPVTDAIRDEMSWSKKVNVKAQPVIVEAPKPEAVVEEVKEPVKVAMPVLVCVSLPLLPVVVAPKAVVVPTKPKKAAPKATKAPVMPSAARTTKKPTKGAAEPKKAAEAKRWSVQKEATGWVATNGKESQTFTSRDKARTHAKSRNA